MSKDLNDVFNEFLLSMVNESNVNLIKELRVRWRMYLGEPVIDFKNKAIFTTDDGVDLSDGKMWLLSTLGWQITDVGICSHPFRGVTGNEFKYFSTKEAAEDYKLMNKPNLSINDTLQALRNIFEKTGEFKPSPGAISMELKKLSKLKTGSADR